MRRRTLITLGATLVIAAALAIGLTACGHSNSSDNEKAQAPEKIINPLTGNEEDSQLPARPTIVSIDNVGDAVPQSNLSYADMIYEFPVEGLQTRLECIFYSQYPEFVGPVRSTRPYFVDLTREYKGVFVAYGWSPDAKRYLKEKYVPWINGMVHNDLFYRVTDKASPHNAYIKWENIEKHASENGDWYSDEHRKKIRAFKFIGIDDQEETTAATDEDGEEVELIEPEDCTKVKFDYAHSHCEFTYDEDSGLYSRSIQGTPYIDKESGDTITCSNILVQKVSSEVLDEKGRLSIDMCEGGDALLFTNGKVTKGTWSRKSLDKRTIFKDENGNEFLLSKGTSWVEVTDQNCTISY